MLIKFPLKFEMMLLFIMVAVFTQSGCMQGQSFAAKRQSNAPSALVPDNTLKIVNGVFYTSLTRSNWYYKGARAFNGTINAYIEAPDELGMDKASLKQYLQYSICPGLDKQFLWQQLQHITLNVHLYTDDQRKGVRTQCQNPLA